MTTTIRTLLVEDQQLVLDALTLLLTSAANDLPIEVVGTAVNGREAISAANDLLPDLIVMDVAMPVLSGTDAVYEIRRRHGDVKILMLSAHQSQHEVQAAKDSGANGYALKHAGREALIGTVKDILSGTAVFPDSAEKVTEENVLVDLTRRERQVLKLLAEGYKNQEIAGLLFISSRTVEKHRASLIEKLGVSSLHDLIDVARQAGLLQ
jgi:DNA-binding NarL/FixJ family response regulator